MVKGYLLFIMLAVPAFVLASNQSNPSFSKAKRILDQQVYTDNRETLYCAATFDQQKKITPVKGFHTKKHVKRAKKVEWEHVVPAENFGRTFTEWRDGDPKCVNSKGKSYKGRRCAEKINHEYRYMQADMFNLFPAIGAVNALRSNYNFSLLPDQRSRFGSCEMKIANRKAEPPIRARGQISRAYLYMDATYSRYKMSKQQKQLMSAWDKNYPVDSWECQRTKKIAKLQNNANLIVQKRCEIKGLW